MIQIVKSLQFIHGKNVVHRDIKLGNLFLTENLTIKIGDFGLAVYGAQTVTDKDKQTVCGTPNYIAPEVLNYEQTHSFPVDVWALGVIIYAMLYGRPPFETNNVKSTYKRIQILDYSFPPQTTVSQ